jgi:hypothetical protein
MIYIYIYIYILSTGQESKGEISLVHNQSPRHEDVSGNTYIGSLFLTSELDEGEW